jgi:hypothetical protein
LAARIPRKEAKTTKETNKGWVALIVVAIPNSLTTASVGEMVSPTMDHPKKITINKIVDPTIPAPNPEKNRMKISSKESGFNKVDFIFCIFCVLFFYLTYRIVPYKSFESKIIFIYQSFLCFL